MWSYKCINDSQAQFAEHQLGKKVYTQQELTLAAPPKKSKPSNSQNLTAPVLVDITRSAPQATESKEESDFRKFKEAVKDAEKSTLIFNLDMGPHHEQRDHLQEGYTCPDQHGRQDWR